MALKFKNDKKISDYVPELTKDDNFIPKDRNFFFNVNKIQLFINILILKDHQYSLPKFYL